jgi:flagellar protein FliO/FliZ
MTRSMTLTRAALRAALPALGIATIGFAVLAGACPAQAFTPSSKAGGEATPLNLAPSAGSSSHASSGGASIVRTIVGLLIVIVVIWGLTWILKQVKSGRERGGAGTGLSSLATLPLGSGRSMHLVRAGRDYLLLGSAEHGVAPIHRYTEQQAREAGLLDLIDGGVETDAGTGGPTGPGRAIARALQMPGQSRRPAGKARPPVGLGEGTGILERLREWTVRR